MTSIQRALRTRARTVVVTFGLATSLLVTAAPPEAAAVGETYRLPWAASETWQVSRGPTSGGSHSSMPNFSAWDFFPVSVSGADAHVLAVGSGTAKVICDDDYQATVELETDQGHKFHYAHLDSDSVASVGLTTSAVDVAQGDDLGGLLNDTNGWSDDCGSGSGPHVHFEIETGAFPMVIDGYTFSLDSQYQGEQLVSTNGASPGGSVHAGPDFNGDGYADMAVGVPGETVGGHDEAGKVQVIYGSGAGASATAARADQAWTQNSANIAGVAEAGDRFGETVTTGDFNGDGYDDMAVGAPGEGVKAKATAGMIHVIYGSSNGLSATAAHADQVFTQNTANIAGAVQAADQFGAALSDGDFNGDGYDDLVIGVPGEDVNGTIDAGAVQIIYGSSNGLSATAAHPDQLFTENTAGIAGNCGAGDQFGAAVHAGDFNGDGYDDIAVGAPGQYVGTSSDAGKVQVIYGSSNGISATAARANQSWHQNAAEVAGAAQSGDQFGASVSAGDFNGDGYDDLVIGVPGEDSNEIPDVGVINIIYGSSNGLSATAAHLDQLFTEDTAGIAGNCGAGDQFGAAVHAGDFNGDGYDDIAVGAPGQYVGTSSDAGKVQVIYGSSNGISATAARANQSWHQNAAEVAGAAQSGDQFGASVSAGDFNGDGYDDMVIGVPGEDVNGTTDAGAVQIIYGSSNGLSATAAHPDQLFTENTANIAGATAPGDQFGTAVHKG